MIIRAFRVSDLPHVLRIERASFGAEGYSAATFLAHAFRDRRGLFVAESEEHEVMGYVLVRLGLRWLGSRKGGITSIAVAPALRRRGIGRRLLQHAIAYLGEHHVDAADLEVNVSNLAAQSLYESLGFRRCRLLPHYYGPSRDGLQMVLDLAAQGAEVRPTEVGSGRPEAR
jgi:ribosomal-protein-alanine N-acetyltransferase